MLHGPIWSKIPRFALPIATTAILYRHLRRRSKAVHVEPGQLRIGKSSMKRILRIGLPAGAQSAVFSVANIIIQGAINSLGALVMAASGAGEIGRCKKAPGLCLGEGITALAAAIAVILPLGKPLLSIFNNDPQMVDVGYIRLVTLMTAHLFSLCGEVLSGYLGGFGISLAPAALTMAGVCGIRLSWIYFVFPKSHTFQTIMAVFPISLAATALLMLIAVLCYRLARRFTPHWNLSQ